MSDTELEILNHYTKAFDAIYALERKAEHLTREVQRLQHENNFMLRLINDHMIGE